MPWRAFAVAALLGAAPPPLAAQQRDVMDVLGAIFGKHADTVREMATIRTPVTTILPAISANPTAGLVLGVSGNVVFRLGPDSETNISAINTSATYGTMGQVSVILRSGIFTHGNGFKFEGDWRYLSATQSTWGLGHIPPDSAESPMDFSMLRFSQSALREIAPNLLIGMGYHLSAYIDIVDRNAVPGVTTPFLAYNGGNTVTSTVSSGLSLNILRDTRDSPINATRGHLASAGLRYSPTWLGSTATWQETRAELRFYQRTPGPARAVLALWFVGWLSGGHTPYFDLPAIGWDTYNRTGRGYVQGRIRSAKLLYGETEYRVGLTRNGLIGAVGFASLTWASDPASGRMTTASLAGGGGLRIKLSKRSGTNITIDYARGPGRSRGLFFGSAEAF
jgi:hypothetical protein